MVPIAFTDDLIVGAVVMAPFFSFIRESLTSHVRFQLCQRVLDYYFAPPPTHISKRMYNSKNARSMRGGFSTLDTVKNPLKYRGVDMNRTGRLVSFKVAVLLTAVMIASCGGGSSGSGGNDLSGDGSNGGQSNPPVLTVPSDAFVFTLDVASTNTIVGSGGTPASCSIAGLPAGLTATVAGNGCAISGTATAPSAQSSYTLTASNDVGTATITIDLSIIDPPVLTVPSNAFVFTVDVASTNTVAGSGGTPASCSIAGLPAGLTATVAGNGCAISGTATAPSPQSSYTLSASNDDGTATITIDLSVIDPPVLTVPSNAFVFTVDVASTNTIAGSGGTPASCSIAGLPAGLTATVAGNGCAISGTATAPLAQSSYTLSASNDDGMSTVTISLSVIIVPPVLAVPSDAFVFALDVASTNTVAGSGSAPTSCSIAGLPAGLLPQSQVTAVPLVALQRPP